MEDIDIPLPDELEWLESQPYHEDDDDDIDPSPFPLPPDEEDEINFERETASESPRSVKPQINGHKRSLVLKELADPCAEKRRRTTTVHEDDEDWLRYFPAGKNEGIEHRDQAASEPEEIMVSRYVSHIDGECVPVTSPSGDRVYAKLCRADIEFWGKKLSSSFRSGGNVFLPYRLIKEHRYLIRAVVLVLLTNSGTYFSYFRIEFLGLNKVIFNC